ncbi:MAG: ABC transporter ATP-binding protein [Jatrophihabitans sp.]
MTPPDNPEIPVLRVTDLVKHHPVRYHRHRAGAHISAVDGVSFTLSRGQTVGIVGESGCGKSTLARLLAALDRPTSGAVEVCGQDLFALHGRALRRARRGIQMIFQDPLSSLNPRMTIREIVAEPFDIHPDILARKHRNRRALELLELVGLNPDRAERHPHEFSGGQRQRVAIARALALHPQVLVCDEPVSALDVSIRAQVVNLLQDLQDEFGLSYVFIAHDLSIVQHIADRTLVMYLGKIVETGDGDDLYNQPRHPYTQTLLAAMPRIDRAPEAPVPDPIDADLPSPADPPSGCRFRTRCWKAQHTCAEHEPPLQTAPGSAAHDTACHFPSTRQPAEPTGD